MTLRAELDSSRGAGSFPQLRAIARGVARRLQAGSDLPDELVSIFLLELVAAEGGGAGLKLSDALQLDEAQLRTRVRRRLYQIALRETPRWELFRALHLHVKEVLERLPTAPANPPSKITTGESNRFSRRQVAKAAAWAVANHDVCDIRVLRGSAAVSARIASTLLDIYFPRPAPLAGETQASDPGLASEDEARRRLGSQALLAELRQRVPPREFHTFARLCAGETLHEIAHDFGVGVATVHLWKQNVISSLQNLSAVRRDSGPTMMALLVRMKYEMLSTYRRPLEDGLPRRARRDADAAAAEAAYEKAASAAGEHWPWPSFRKTD